MVPLIAILAGVFIGIPVLTGSVFFWWALLCVIWTPTEQPSLLDDGVYQ